MRLFKRQDYRFIVYDVTVTTNLSDSQIKKIYQLFNVDSNLETEFIDKNQAYLEVKPISNSTPWSSNVMKICRTSNLDFITNVRKSYLYNLRSYRNDLNLSKLSDPELKEFIFNKNHDRMTETYSNNLCSSDQESYTDKIENLEDIKTANLKYGLSLDAKDIDYVAKNLDKMDNPLFVLMDMAQSNSEHCRHHFFTGKIIEDGIEQLETLFDLVKAPLKKKVKSQEDKDSECLLPNNLVAFSDNSSVIRGYGHTYLDIKNNRYKLFANKHHYVLTAETHNFPSGIAPFQGAATGIGGRIRDVQATGIGARPVCSSAGYCVGEILFPGPVVESIKNRSTLAIDYPSHMAKPLDILIQASNGASDYGNKFGEPIILGFTRSFRSDECERTEWIKPIMFTAGLGLIKHNHIYKKKIKPGMLICKIGGPAYKVGLGGGAASSRISEEKHSELDFSAVQRDDAEMEQKMNRVILSCISLGMDNPIVSIHDQGAGGNGNVLKEIIEDKGAIIDLGKITLGDESMNDIEIWLSEYQESNAVLIESESLPVMKKICQREDVKLDVVGTITGDSKLKIVHGDRVIVEDYPLDFKSEKRTYLITKPDSIDKFREKSFEQIPNSIDINRLEYISKHFENNLNKVLSSITVGSKRFLTNKVDRSVTGLIAQQQCIGPLHTPLSNYGLMASGFLKTNLNSKSNIRQTSHKMLNLSEKDNIYDVSPSPNYRYTGCATSIGEQPLFGLLDPISMVHKTVAEMLTNLMFVLIDDFNDISASANWMWPCPNKDPEEGYKMNLAMKELSKVFKELDITIDGGKDSLSMAVKHDNKTVKCPGSLVLSAYASCPDIYKKVTPDLKSTSSALYFIDLSDGNFNMGGSLYSSLNNMLMCPTMNPPYVPDFSKVKKTFNLIQKLISRDMILSGHDKSDGGLITTLIEMSISSNIGLEINLNEDITQGRSIEYLFNEDIGLVIEVDAGSDVRCLDKFGLSILDLLKTLNINAYEIAKTVVTKDVTLKTNNITFYKEDIHKLRSIWETPSYELEKHQCNKELVKIEKEFYSNLASYQSPKWSMTFRHINFISDVSKTYNVGIIREEGSNSDKEMASAFYLANHSVTDINMNDMIENPNLLDQYNVIVFVGGFSFADVLGSATGWYSVIKNNSNISKQFEKYFNREDTYSLGICNGCQLMVKLGWLGPGISMAKNDSGRFESRFSNVRVSESNSLFLKPLTDLEFGIWVAHGEGKFVIEPEIMDKLNRENRIPMRYIDNYGQIADEKTYPFNPNGSKNGVASILSENHRHLAMMPHPERSFMIWQIPYLPNEIKSRLKKWDNGYTPWFNMFTL